MLVTKGYGSQGGLITQGFGFLNTILQALANGAGWLLDTLFLRFVKEQEHKVLKPLVANFWMLRMEKRKKKKTFQVGVTPVYQSPMGTIRVESVEVSERPVRISAVL